MHSVAISKRREDQLRRLIEKRRTADRAAERARLELRRAIELAREEGGSFEEIADVIGITRQRAWAMFKKND
jgi:DNA-directed RNA polymerase specialized sigma24 family protein